MLEVGNGKLTDAEGRSQMALWCLMRAPLLSGTDVSRATKATIATLTAGDVIAVSQDVRSDEYFSRHPLRVFPRTFF